MAIVYFLKALNAADQKKDLVHTPLSFQQSENYLTFVTSFRIIFL